MRWGRAPRGREPAWRESAQPAPSHFSPLSFLSGTKGPFSLSLWVKTDPADTTGDTFGYPFSHSALVRGNGGERRRERGAGALSPHASRPAFLICSVCLPFRAQATPEAPAPTDPFHSPGVHILVPDAAQ